MTYHETQEWKNLHDLLDQEGVEYNILEEQIDVDTQREFMKLMHTLMQKQQEFKQRQENALPDAHLLEDETLSLQEKKELLLTLSTIENISAYRTIEAFQKKETPLKAWATIALQQSRMIIQASLLDDKTIYVSTGLGGRGKLLRYFCVFIAQKGNIIKPFQHTTLFNETEQALSRVGGEIEEHDPNDFFDTFTLLMPLDVDIKSLFENIIKECNTYGNFLSQHMIITNVKKIPLPEIEQYLHSQQLDDETKQTS